MPEDNAEPTTERPCAPEPTEQPAPSRPSSLRPAETEPPAPEPTAPPSPEPDRDPRRQTSLPNRTPSSPGPPMRASSRSSPTAGAPRSRPSDRSRCVASPSAPPLAISCDALRATRGVARVEADRVRAVEAVPTDSSYADQWALPQIGWEQAYGDVDPAGSAVVAVLDTGVDASHPTSTATSSPARPFVEGADLATATPTATAPPWPASSPPRPTTATGIAGVGYAGVIRHARHRPRRRRHRPGQRHHRGRRLGGRPRRRRHPHGLQQPPATRPPSRPPSTTPGRTASSSSPPPATTAPRTADLPGRRRAASSASPATDSSDALAALLQLRRRPSSWAPRASAS